MKNCFLVKSTLFSRIGGLKIFWGEKKDRARIFSHFFNQKTTFFSNFWTLLVLGPKARKIFWALFQKKIPPPTQIVKPLICWNVTVPLLAPWRAVAAVGHTIFYRATVLNWVGLRGKMSLFGKKNGFQIRNLWHFFSQKTTFFSNFWTLMVLGPKARKKKLYPFQKKTLRFAPP